MDEYFLLRPIMHNFYTYKDLLDGSLNLVDIAMCNDMLNVVNYNSNIRT